MKVLSFDMTEEFCSTIRNTELEEGLNIIDPEVSFEYAGINYTMFIKAKVFLDSEDEEVRISEYTKTLHNDDDDTHTLHAYINEDEVEELQKQLISNYFN